MAGLAQTKNTVLPLISY